MLDGDATGLPEETGSTMPEHGGVCYIVDRKYRPRQANRTKARESIMTSTRQLKPYKLQGYELNSCKVDCQQDRMSPKLANQETIARTLAPHAIRQPMLAGGLGQRPPPGRKELRCPLNWSIEFCVLPESMALCVLFEIEI
jgi:hypothetical protein